MFGVVFAETGLLLGFFLPGDSFLFTIGVVSGLGAVDIVTVNILLMMAAIVGDSTGYFLGRQTGPKIFSRPDSRFFKQEYVTRTPSAFYDRYGGKTITFARFVPIVRTFSRRSSPEVGQMPYLRFLPYSICGGVGWVFLCTTLGYFLGRIPLVKQEQLRTERHHPDRSGCPLLPTGRRSHQSPAARLEARLLPELSRRA